MKVLCSKCGAAVSSPQNGHAVCSACVAEAATAASRRRAPALPAEIAGYRIVAPIAQGAYGAVYRAVSPDGSTVALKVLAADGPHTPEAVERFQREAQATMNLAHPNIVRVLDAGYASRRHFIAMEFVGTTSLRGLIDGKEIELRRAVEILRDLARALHHAHTRGVIHRDLKPENVLLTEDGLPKITDFGIAKLAGSSRTRLTGAGIALGTPEYMSPEQASGRSREADARSDVYAIGVILYEVATGKLPYRGRSVVDTLRRIEEGAAAPPSQLHKDVDASLESIILKAMARDPNLRYDSAEQLGEDLDRWLRGEPVRAPASSVWAGLVGRLFRRRSR